MAYDVKALMDKLNKMNSKGGDKLNFAKLEFGEHQVRFLPVGAEGQPMLEVAFYREEKLVGQWKVPTAAQFGMDDPIHEFLEEMSKDRSKESWNLRKQINPRTSWFVPVVFRGKESEGVKVLEMSDALMKAYLRGLVNEDFQDVNLLDPEKGHDWTLTVSATDKTYKNYKVKEFALVPRVKSTKLAKDKVEMDKLLAQVPDILAYYKSRVLEVEKARERLSAFLEAYHADPMTGVTTPEGQDRNQTKGAGNLTDENRQKIEDQFSDLG